MPGRCDLVASADDLALVEEGGEDSRLDQPDGREPAQAGSWKNRGDHLSQDHGKITGVKFEHGQLEIGT